MKVLIVFVAIIVAISTANDLKIWEQYKKTHNKTYKSLLEESARFGIFKNNLRNIEKHNIRYNNEDESYYKGINKFSDWTSNEFRKLLTYKRPTHSTNKKFVRNPNFVAPESVDWRERGAVLEVEDQGDCGSGYAFSAIGGIEGQNAIKNNRSISLSKQELIDCSIAGGCDSGTIGFAYTYVMSSGIATEEDYPYKAFELKCQSQYKPRSGVNVTSCYYLEPTEDDLLEAVATIGPISVFINADMLQSYEGGIFNESSCSDDLNHGVLTVGYGTENNTPYWIIKNSWGVGWGENGYFRLIRNANQQCGIGGESMYPIM